MMLFQNCAEFLDRVSPISRMVKLGIFPGDSHDTVIIDHALKLDPAGNTSREERALVGKTTTDRRLTKTKNSVDLYK